MTAIPSGAAEPRLVQPDDTKLLFLDARLVQSVRDARLKIGRVVKDAHNPLFRADLPWENALNNLYPNVLWDGKRFRLWYKCVVHDRAAVAKMARPTLVHDQGWYLLHATSDDGIDWKKPLRPDFPFDGLPTNAVAQDTPNVGVLRDGRDPDPQRRFKMIYDVGLGKLRVRFSPDGLRWSEPVAAKGFGAYHGDTHNNAFRDERSGKFVLFTKLYLGERLVARFESDDFLTWRTTGLALRSSVEEGQRTQTYCLTAFPYANGYLGYAMMYHAGKDRSVDCELAWSEDSIHWQRVAPGEPLIPRGPAGSYDAGCVYGPAGPPIARDDKLLLLYGGSEAKHLGWKRHCLPCLARLRVDGFAGYEPTKADRPGVIVTQPLRVVAPLRLSADAKGGSIRVRVLDVPGFDNEATIAADVTDEPLRWAGATEN